MRTRIAISLALVAGFGLGAVTIQGLHAQAKPPVYYIGEIDVHNVDAYLQDYAPKAQALIRSHGGRFVAVSNNPTPVEGTPPKSRVVIQQWDSMEKINAWRSSPEYKELRKIGDQHATFRAFAVPGLPQQ
jgi:uncharacterized protein (DUF1330 family)